jgi:mannitol/fructose-specific phosphotransferase system IIA component (Ntr-type)
MKLRELIPQDSIIPELESTSRAGVIRELVEKLASAGRLPAELTESVIKSIVTRERSRGSTGFGKGVAIPHTKLDGVTSVVAAAGRSSKGVDFAALDGAPVYIVFLILSPERDPDSHLKAMDVVFRQLQNERFRKFFRQSDTAEKIYDLLGEADEQPAGS